MLSTMKMYFQWLCEPNDTEKNKLIAQKGLGFINETLEELKTISNNISPRLLTEYGLVPAVKHFTERIKFLNKINIDFQFNNQERYNQYYEFTLYRVLTKLINNTIKHSYAKNIFIDYRYDLTQNVLNFKYSDNGKGFDVKEAIKKSTGMGIANIYYRVKTIGGEIDIKSTEKETCFQISLSLNNF